MYENLGELNNIDTVFIEIHSLNWLVSIEAFGALHFRPLPS